MDRVALLDFVNRYTRIVTRLWGDEQARHRLVSDPCAVLAESGWRIPRDSIVDVIEHDDADLDLQARLDVWNEGYSSGRFVLLIARHPAPASDELDESVLGDLAGGFHASVGTPIQ